MLAVLFMLGALALAIIGQRGPGSIISGSAPPPRPASAPRGTGARPDDTGARPDDTGARTDRTGAEMTLEIGELVNS